MKLIVAAFAGIAAAASATGITTAGQTPPNPIRSRAAR